MIRNRNGRLDWRNRNSLCGRTERAVILTRRGNNTLSGATGMAMHNGITKGPSKDTVPETRYQKLDTRN